MTGKTELNAGSFTEAGKAKTRKNEKILEEK
jgi:hypothetical protein